MLLFSNLCHTRSMKVSASLIGVSKREQVTVFLLSRDCG